MKTNKSYSKRLKLTKSGKILARKAGQNHFNSKERTKVKGSKGRMVSIPMTNKTASRYLVNIK